MVIATGTFLDAKIFCGEERIAGGRTDERAAIPLAGQIREIGLGQGRLKTGTPPRLDGRTIDWARLAGQPSDADCWTMSAMDEGVSPPQSPARSRGPMTDAPSDPPGFDRSPWFAGAIEGAAALTAVDEDKGADSVIATAIRFSSSPRAGYTSGIQRLSTSLPADLQLEFVRRSRDWSAGEIVRPGYASNMSMPTRGARFYARKPRVWRAVLAGQINGTTGYEEAAAQGPRGRPECRGRLRLTLPGQLRSPLELRRA